MEITMNAFSIPLFGLKSNTDNVTLRGSHQHPPMRSTVVIIEKDKSVHIGFYDYEDENWAVLDSKIIGWHDNNGEFQIPGISQDESKIKGWCFLSEATKKTAKAYKKQKKIIPDWDNSGIINSEDPWNADLGPHGHWKEPWIPPRGWLDGYKPLIENRG
jgi:hypothetical protein